MAALDKTYVNREQALQIIDWCKSIWEVTLENGYKFKPIDFVCLIDSLELPNFGYREDIKEYCLWNTSTWFDRWLWMNCPFDFIKNRIKEQYTKDVLKSFESFHYSKSSNQLDFGKQHYQFIEEPKWHGHKYWMSHGNFLNNKRISYEIIVVFPNSTSDTSYDIVSNEWGNKYFGLLPYEDNYYWEDYHKHIPTKKSILRQLRKWYFPKGTIIKLINWNYEALDFVIKVK